MRTRVLLADGEGVLRNGLTLLLRQRGYRIVAEARDGAAAVRHAQRHKPDLAVLEIVLPDMDGLDAAREISRVSPRTRVILLTALRSEHRVLQALRDGAKGFVLKVQPAAELLRALDEVRRGGTYVAPGLSAMVAGAARTARALAGEPLTRRERQVLELVADGKKTKEIAPLLHISVKTVGFHRTRIMRKVNIHDTAGLVRYAVRSGLVTP